MAEETLDSFAQRMNGAAASIDSISFRQPLTTCSVLVWAAARENFQGSHTPDGTAWAPLKRARTLPKSRRKSVKARRARTGERDKPLLDKGILQASVTGKAQGSILDISDYELRQGTNISYAGFQHYGTRYIPARPFLGFNDALLEKIDNVFADHAAKEIAKRL